MARQNTVVASKHLSEIHDCLVNRWPATAIVQHLQRQHGSDDPSIPDVKAIRRYARQEFAGGQGLVPSNPLQEKLAELRVKIDLEQLYARVIWLMEQRLGASWKLEQEMFGGMASPNTDRVAQMLLQYGEKYRALLQDLGLLPSAAIRTRSDGDGVDAAPMVVTNDEFRDLLEAVADARSRTGAAAPSGEPGRLAGDPR